MYRQPKLEDIWDSAQRKLLVLPVEAQGLAAKDSNGFSDPYVKIHYGKESWKTSVYKKTVSPLFPTKELFLVRVDGYSELNIELWDKDKFSKDEFLGLVSLGKPEDRFKAESIHEEWFQLKPRPNKKKDVVAGRIKIRFYFSCQPETRPESAIDDHVFYYEAIQNRFRSGDVILFDGSGLLQAWTKILSNSIYSSVGLIIELPNKWTRKKELYILEVTRNVDHFLDAFKEVPSTHSNICIFRLFERLHQFHGNSIHYLPVRAQLQQTQQFYELLNGLGSGQTTLNAIIRQIPGTKLVGYPAVMDIHDSPLPDLVEFLQRLMDKQVLKTAIGPNFLDVAKDVFTAKVVLRFLQTMGKPVTKEPERIWPIDFVKDNEWFESPILIREKRANSSAPPAIQSSQIFPMGITQYAPPTYLLQPVAPNTAVAPSMYDNNMNNPQMMQVGGGGQPIMQGSGGGQPPMQQQQQYNGYPPPMQPNNNNYPPSNAMTNSGGSGGYPNINNNNNPPQSPNSPPPYFGHHHNVPNTNNTGNNGYSVPIEPQQQQQQQPAFTSNYPDLRPPSGNYPPSNMGTMRPGGQF